MGHIILTVILSVYALGATWLILRLTKESEKRQNAKTSADLLHAAELSRVEDKLAYEELKSEHKIADLESRLSAALFSLEMALAEDGGGAFDGVTVEIGINGTVYQFHQLDKKEV